MKINITEQNSFRAQKMINDLNSVLSQLISGNEFIRNNVPGEYELACLGRTIKPKDDEAFWNNVTEVLNNYYDVILTEDELTIMYKGTVHPVKVEVKPEDKQEKTKSEDPRQRKETNKKPAKSIKQRLFGKAKKVSDD